MEIAGRLDRESRRPPDVILYQFSCSTSLPLTVFSHSTVNCLGQGSCLWFVKSAATCKEHILLIAGETRALITGACMQNSSSLCKGAFFPVYVGACNHWISKSQRCTLENSWVCTYWAACWSSSVWAPWVLSLTHSLPLCCFISLEQLH